MRQSIIDYILLDPDERSRLGIEVQNKPFQQKIVEGPSPWNHSTVWGSFLLLLCPFFLFVAGFCSYFQLAFCPKPSGEHVLSVKETNTRRLEISFSNHIAWDLGTENPNSPLFQYLGKGNGRGISGFRLISVLLYSIKSNHITPNNLMTWFFFFQDLPTVALQESLLYLASHVRNKQAVVHKIQGQETFWSCWVNRWWYSQSSRAQEQCNYEECWVQRNCPAGGVNALLHKYIFYV